MDRSRTETMSPGFHAIRRDVHPLAVDLNVAVVDELARGERCRHELGAVDNGVEARLQQTDQVLGARALAAGGFLISLRELLLGDVAVVALQLLLGAQLKAEVRDLVLATLAVLTGAVGALIDGGFRAPPDVFTHAPVKLVLGRMTLRHAVSLPCSTRAGASAREARFQRRLHITRNGFRAARRTGDVKDWLMEFVCCFVVNVGRHLRQYATPPLGQRRHHARIVRTS